MLSRFAPFVRRLLVGLLVVAALALIVTGRAGGMATGLLFLGVALVLYRLDDLERRITKLHAVLIVLAVRGEPFPTLEPDRVNEPPP